jgi:hypothetical protein
LIKYIDIPLPAIGNAALQSWLRDKVLDLEAPTEWSLHADDLIDVI